MTETPHPDRSAAEMAEAVRERGARGKAQHEAREAAKADVTPKVPLTPEQQANVDRAMAEWRARRARNDPRS